MSNLKNYLFTSESVSEGHPDKVSDRISDMVVDSYLSNDPFSRVACETLTTTNKVVLAGEVRGPEIKKEELIQKVRDCIKDIGYDQDGFTWRDATKIESHLHSQSTDIAMGVDSSGNKDEGAGDQGIMFGYASKETDNYIPLALDLSHKILIELAALRRENDAITYLRPDAKSQVTIEYDDQNQALRIDTIVVSTQHDDFDSDEEKMLEKIKSDIVSILIPRVLAKCEAHVQQRFGSDITYHVNPTGKFVIGGPHGDTGLTGRKIIVDTYGGKGGHGGGAFSGKDPSKVDRSAAYASRHMAKNLVAAGIADEILVQLSYAIGVVEPTSVCVNTYGTAKVDLTDAEIADKAKALFDLRPYAIEQRLKLRNPMYLETASYGHMGRTPRTITKTFESPYNGKVSKEVALFTWEQLDHVETIKNSFKL